MSQLNIPGYVIKEKIGTGGMATVYLAVQSSLERLVALKVMSPALAADQNFSKRFLREARTIASLSHPHIVPIYEVGVTENYLHYFAMQHLPGGDLAGRLRRGIDEMELVRVLTAIARALGFAHEHGFVHRDVTPGNILFDKTDNPVLTDFGIARDMSQTTRITNTGVSVGTSQYMSPEQARGGNIDYRSDLYSLGTVCFECLAGRPPYEGVDGFAIAYAHVFEPVPQLEERLAHWQPFIDCALAKDPAERFQGADSLIAALNELAKSRMGSPQALQEYVTRTMVSSVGAAVVRSTPPEAQASVTAVDQRVTAARKTVPPAPARTTSAAATVPAESDVAPGMRPRTVLALAATALALLLIAAVWWWSHMRAPAAPVTNVPVPATTALPPPKPFAPAASTAVVAPVPAEKPAGSESLMAPSASPALPEVDTATGEIIDPNAVLTPDIPLTPEEVRAALLAQAALDVKQGRLGLPKGANAVERYNAVLAEDPTNAEALAGLRAVVERYLGMAERARSGDKLEQVAPMFERATSVAQSRPELSDTLGVIASRETAMLAQLKEPAERALAAKDKAAAEQAFRQWLRYSPKDPDALAGLEAAMAVVKEVKKPYDKLKSGGNGPEMIAVTLSMDGAQRDLAIGATEVTVAQFEQFMARSDYGKRRDTRFNCRDLMANFSFRKRTYVDPGFKQDPQAPVVCVSFADAQAYAQWLSAQTGQRYRLPSAQEWRAMTQQTVVVGPPSCARGNLADLSLARVERNMPHLKCEDNHPNTAPARAFGGSSLGLYGTVGNVREWVSNCARAAASGCNERVAVGTGWASDAGEDLITQQNSVRSDAAANDIGFRIVKEVSAPE